MLVDPGVYRNFPAEHLHTLIGFDGLPPADLRAAASPCSGDAKSLRLTLDDGATVDTLGRVRIDAMGRTSRVGIYAAGDRAHQRELPKSMQSISIGAGAVAGAAVAADALAHPRASRGCRAGLSARRLEG